MEPSKLEVVMIRWKRMIKCIVNSMVPFFKHPEASSFYYYVDSIIEMKIFSQLSLTLNLLPLVFVLFFLPLQ